MSPSPLQVVGLILYYGIPMVTITYLNLRWYQKKLGKNLCISLWIGILLASCWNIPLGYLGNQYQILCSPNPIGVGLYLVRSCWDGMMLLGGLTLIKRKTITRPNEWVKCLSFTTIELSQKIIVEFIENGRTWKYKTGLSWNPVIFTIGNTPYTMMPYLIWLIAPICYYRVTLLIGPLFKNSLRLPTVLYLDYDSSDSDSDLDYYHIPVN